MYSFYQICKWSWPDYVVLNGGYEDVFSTREAAEGRLMAMRDRGEKRAFIAELLVSEKDLSTEFLKHVAAKEEAIA